MSRPLSRLVALAVLCLAFAHAEARAQSKLVPGAGSEEEYFGASVDIEGDHAIVGAPGGFPFIEGSAYIYEREGGRWIETARLTKPSGPRWRRREGAWFGRSVGISGDYAIVGVPGDNVRRLPATGSAFVYVRDGDRWVEQAELVPEDLSSGQEFGWSVAIDGDYAIVGARGDEPKGSAYIFARDGTSWSQQSKLKGGTGPKSQNFGWSVAIDGAYAIVGDPEQPRRGNGSAYVFGRHGTAWLGQARIVASDGEPADWFGFSVAIDGGLAVVGAPEHSPMECRSAEGEGGCGSFAGAGYVFRRAGTGWSEEVKLRAIEAAHYVVPQIAVGTSVAIAGDLVILGAHSAHGALGDEVPIEKAHIGAAYLYRRAGGNWWKVEKIVADDGAENDDFGVAVAIDGACPLVGTSLSDPRGHDSGAAYICGEACPQTAERPKVVVEPLEHQFFLDDEGEFELSIGHWGGGGGPVNVELTLGLLEGMPPGNPPKTGDPPRLPDDTPTTFIEGLESETFPLQPLERRAFKVEVADFMPLMKHFEKDILFGANLQIRARQACEGAWLASEAGPVVFEDELNIYRYLDVADDDHDDGIVAMARTLGDGPGGVVRTRPLDLHVHEDAAVKLRVADSTDFAFSSGEVYPTAFVFNPAERTRRDPEPASTVVFVETEEGEQVGSVVMSGVAEPKNKLYFNVRGLSDEWEMSLFHALGRIIARTGVADNSQPRPPSYEVHPALVTTSEVEILDMPDEHVTLWRQVETKLEQLLGPTLMEGLEWAEDVDPKNSVTLRWRLRDNRKSRYPKPFALGKTKPEDLTEIRAIIEARDEYNPAERAYRLAEAVNPSLRAYVYVHPDSVLESHKGFGANQLSLTFSQLVNALAKTALHEIGHTMSLVHSAQMDDRKGKEEYQKLQLLVTENCNDTKEGGETWDGTTLTLSFEDVETAPITLERRSEEGLPFTYDWKRTVGSALIKIKSIGNKNYHVPPDPDANGIYMWTCSAIKRDYPEASGTDCDKDENVPPCLVIDRCGEVPNEEACRTYIVEFGNHLGGADVELLEVHPPGMGAVEELRAGQTGLQLKGRVPQAQAERDIMFGGFNDIGGILGVRPGVSLEALKMALALDYTQEEADSAVEMYAAAFEAWKKLQ